MSTMPSVCSISFFIFQSRGIEPVKIVAENLYSNLGPRCRRAWRRYGGKSAALSRHSLRGADAVSHAARWRLHAVSGHGPESMAPRVPDVYAQGVLVKFGSARLAGHPLTSGTDMMMRSASRPTASLWSSDIPGSALRLMVNDPSLNAGRKLRPSVKNSATLTAKESTGAPEDYFRMGQRGNAGVRA